MGAADRITVRLARECVAARLRAEHAPPAIADQVDAEWRAAAAVCDRWLADASDPSAGEDEVVALLSGVAR